MLRSWYLPIWTLLVALLLAACAEQVAKEDSLPLAPTQSPNDDRDYRYIQLDNGLRALLISDPDTEKSAASLDVYVGSASNPTDRGGLAHFLEHMLFLGTDKYPDSGEYARFVSEHGGNRNAYTAFEHTNYFFDIDKDHLPEALDRFAQFFIAPRFDAEYVDREVNAVNAEYLMGLNTDSRRNLDVARETVNPEHRSYSKRTMAQDMVTVMKRLGHARFFLAGHDRGARVAYRLTLDHPQRVLRLASLDTVPTLDIWEAMDWEAALEAFHWPFLAQPGGLPERLIGADPDFFLDYLLDRWAGRAGALDSAAVAQYREHFRKPSVQTAMAEDYRAGATIDLQHDREDRAAGRKIACPVFVPWGCRYTKSSPLAVWRRWADNVRELELDCGHFIAEEAPEASAVALADFFTP